MLRPPARKTAFSEYLTVEISEKPRTTKISTIKVTKSREKKAANRIDGCCVCVMFSLLFAPKKDLAKETASKRKFDASRERRSKIGEESDA